MARRRKSSRHEFPAAPWDWFEHQLAEMPNYSSKVVLPQFMPSDRPCEPVVAPFKGPRYSVDPANPLGLHGHEAVRVTEPMVLELERVGFVIVKIEDWKPQ